MITDASRPEPRSRATAGQWLVYAAARIAVWLLAVLPLRWVIATMRGGARLWHVLDRRHRKRMEDALTRSLGLDTGAARAVAAGVYPHFAAALVEFLRLSRLPLAAQEACVRYDVELVDRLTGLIRERGALFVTGHIGLWELTGAWLAWRGWSRKAIARSFANPLIDAWVRRLREGFGQEIRNRNGGLLFALRALRRGEGFGMVTDRDGGASGVPVPFFGQMASTIPTAADLALASGVPIIVLALLREGPLRYRAVITEPFEPDPKAPDPAVERLRLLAEMNRRFEYLIRLAPEQWIWSHRRWQTAEKWAAESVTG